jgi:RNA polymerase sigma-70 factor (ECF subfamily)
MKRTIVRQPMEVRDLASLSDEDLVLALGAGDTDSLGVLVARWERPLYSFAYRLLSKPEDARDVCQETFLRVLKKADRFKKGARFSTWMYQIALNLCRDHMRKKRRWSLLIADTPAAGSDGATDFDRFASGDDPSEGVERREQREAVSRALSRIPSEQREVLILKEFEGLRFREIADILGCPESTVKSRMYYGLSGLRAVLSREGVRGV